MPPPRARTPRTAAASTGKLDIEGPPPPAPPPPRGLIGLRKVRETHLPIKAGGTLWRSCVHPLFLQSAPMCLRNGSVPTCLNLVPGPLRTARPLRAVTSSRQTLTAGIGLRKVRETHLPIQAGGTLPRSWVQPLLLQSALMCLRNG